MGELLKNAGAEVGTGRLSTASDQDGNSGKKWTHRGAVACVRSVRRRLSLLRAPLCDPVATTQWHLEPEFAGKPNGSKPGGWGDPPEQAERNDHEQPSKARREAAQPGNAECQSFRNSPCNREGCMTVLNWSFEGEAVLAVLAQDTHISSRQERDMVQRMWSTVWVVSANERLHRSFWPVQDGRNAVGVAILINPHVGINFRQAELDILSTPCIALENGQTKVVNVYAPTRDSTHEQERFFVEMPRLPRVGRG